MSRRVVLLIVVASLLGLAAAPLAAQERQQRTFEPRKGYEQKTLGAVELEVGTREGPKTVRLSLLKLRIVGGQRTTEVQLPPGGLALLQHRAGDAEVGLGGANRFAPLEGEWMRLPLPGRLVIGADDSVLMDLIVPDGRVDPGGRTLAALAQRDNSGQRFHYPAGPQAPLANIARPYIGATEAPENRMGTDSRMREIFEADSHFKDGDTDGYPWCCSFVSMCVQKLIQAHVVYGHVRAPRTASVTNFRTRWAPSQSCLVFRPNDPSHKPHKGDVVVFTFSHIGVVDEVGTNVVLTIEGNTNEAGSREGTIVRRKDRAFPIIRCFIRLPIPVAYDVSELMCVA